MRSRRPDSSASCDEQLEGLVGDAVLGVVEEEAGGLVMVVTPRSFSGAIHCAKMGAMA
jgi:hypothetical protein